MERTLGVQLRIESDTFTFTILLKDSTVALSSRHLLERPSAHRSSNEVDEVEVTNNGGADFVIPRCCKPPRFGKVKKAEFHQFTDASVKDYSRSVQLPLNDR